MRASKTISEEVRDGILMLAVAMPRGFLLEDVMQACQINRVKAYRSMAHLRDCGAIACTWVGKGARWTTAEKMPALRAKLHAEAAERDRKARTMWMQRKREELREIAKRRDSAEFVQVIRRQSANDVKAQITGPRSVWDLAA